MPAFTPSHEQSHPAAALRVLLNGVVDYAGLFPPASLPIAEAAAEYVTHRDGPDAWALGRFVLPAARLDEFDAAASGRLPRESARSWALSALLGSDVEEDIQRIDRFNERHGNVRSGAVIVDTVELKAPTPRDVARADSLLDRRFDTYMEVPTVDDPEDLIAAVARTTAKAKIRTGGVTADAFPTSAQVIRFIEACLAHGVSFKATAGLHHPWRAEYRLTYMPDAPSAPMYGFLNMLLTVAAAREGWPRADVVAVLEERDAGSVRFGSDGAQWRGRLLGIDALERARDSMASFGSCSFREPVDELRALRLL